MREPSRYEAPSCATIGGDFWFPENNPGEEEAYVNGEYAKQICNRCPHKSECAEWGITKERFGIWGGLLPVHRSKIRRQRGISLIEEGQVA